MDMIFDWLKHHGVDIIVIVVIGTIFYYVGTLAVRKIIRRAVQTRGRTWNRKDIEKRQNTLVGLFVNVWKALVVVTTVLIIFRTLLPDISLAPIFASAGIVGIGIGFGSQSLVKDFLSGIFIISENQYRVGDIVDLEGAAGTVERIGVRSTVLRDPDGNVHYVPNGMVQHVINKTMGYSMARFSIAVAPSSDLDQVIAIVNKVGEALANDPAWKNKIIEAPAFLSVGDFTASSVSVLISGKTQPSDQWSVASEMRRHIFAAFEENSIELGLNSFVAPAATVPTKKK